MFFNLKNRRSKNHRSKMANTLDEEMALGVKGIKPNVVVVFLLFVFNVFMIFF